MSLPVVLSASTTIVVDLTTLHSVRVVADGGNAALHVRHRGDVDNLDKYQATEEEVVAAKARIDAVLTTRFRVASKGTGAPVPRKPRAPKVDNVGAAVAGDDAKAVNGAKEKPKAEKAEKPSQPKEKAKAKEHKEHKEHKPKVHKEKRAKVATASSEEDVDDDDDVDA